MAVILHERRKLKIVAHDLVIYLLDILSLGSDKGVVSAQEFEHDGTKWPKVCAVGVSFVEKDLGSHIFRSSDEAEGSVLVLWHFFACAHIHELQISISAHHDVLRFEVSVDDGLMMEGFKDMDQNGYVKSCLFNWKNADGSDNIKQVLSFDVLSEEVDVVVVFEGTIVFNKEGRIL